MRVDHYENWIGASQLVSESEVSRKANFISSQVEFKIKKIGFRSLKLKVRIFVHGNRDADRALMRSDCANADMILVVLAIRLAAIIGFNMRTAYMKGSCMQSFPIQRKVHVRPPKELNWKRGLVCRFSELSYVMVDSGREWLRRSDGWRLGEAGMNGVEGFNQVIKKS